MVKGQLISKGHFGVFKSTKNNNKIFVSISVLASKKWLNQKSQGTLLALKKPLIIDIKCLYFFDLTSF